MATASSVASNGVSPGASAGASPGASSESTTISAMSSASMSPTAMASSVSCSPATVAAAMIPLPLAAATKSSAHSSICDSSWISAGCLPRSETGFSRPLGASSMYTTAPMNTKVAVNTLIRMPAISVAASSRINSIQNLPTQ